MGRALHKLVGWRELQSMCGGVWEGHSLEKGKYLAYSYTATRVNVYCKLSIFFPHCYLRSRTEILITVSSFWIFSRNHFLRGDFMFHWMKGSFSVGDSFLGGEGTPLGLILLWWERVGGKKSHGVGGTLIMPLPTRENPGLCCNRIEKKHEL